jgi:hypothetical protein
MEKKLVTEEKIESLEIFEAIEGVEELTQRYEYSDTVWFCNYTVRF